DRAHGQRPDIIVGTSVGALNAAYLAAHAHEVDTARLMEEGCEAWRRIRYRNVLAPILSIGELTTVGRIAVSLALGGVAPYSLLDPAPLGATLSKLITFQQ